MNKEVRLIHKWSTTTKWEQINAEMSYIQMKVCHSLNIRRSGGKLANHTAYGGIGSANLLPYLDCG